MNEILGGIGRESTKKEFSPLRVSELNLIYFRYLRRVQL